MDQAAFKALVAGAGKTFEDVVPAGKTEAEKQARKEAKAKKSAKYREAKEAAASAGKDSSYRDRAAERRLGDEAQAAEEALYASVDVHKSKYLGGDEQHTHLVKGLDKVLLDRLRKSVPIPTPTAVPPAPSAASSDLPAPSAVAGLGGFGALHAAAAGAAAAVLRGEETGTHHTPMARALSSLLTSSAFQEAQASLYGDGGSVAGGGSAPPSAREGLSTSVASALSSALGLSSTAGGADRWAPGRHTLTYQLSWDGDAGVPTTLMRSAGDCPPPKEGLVDVIDPRVRTTLLLGLAGKGGGRKALPPSLPRPGNPPPAPPASAAGGGGADSDSDEDIFGDAKAYAPLAGMATPTAGGGSVAPAAGVEVAASAADVAAAEAAFKSAFAPAVQEEGDEEVDLTDAGGRLMGLSVNAAAMGDAGYGYGEFAGGVGAGEEEEEEEAPGRKRRREVSEEEAGKREERRASQKAATRFEKEFVTVTGLMEAKAKKARKG